MNVDSESKASKVPDEIFSGLSTLVTNNSAIAAFKDAVFREDLWEKAKADPGSYFGGRGIEIPHNIEINFTDHHSIRPWPRPEVEFQMVVVRCWWVVPKPPALPFHYCFEVPADLLEFIKSLGTP